MTINITHTTNTVHDDGEAMSPGEARHKAALLLVHADEAEQAEIVRLGFRAMEHAGELTARDQRTTEH